MRGGIGLDDNLPWSIPSDFRFFEDISRGTHDSSKINGLVMGRKTWESLAIRPPPGVKPIVLTTRSR
jgi:dihydrofolate reductase